MIRTTILAGTLAPAADARTDLPLALVPVMPEPGWAERDLRTLAPVLEVQAWAWPLDTGEILAAFAGGLTDPVALLTAPTDRIARHPASQDAVLTLIPGADSLARESATRIRRGQMRPLEGILVGVDNIIDLGGIRGTRGSSQTGDRTAAADATVLARLRAQGAISFAILATTELACGSAYNPRYEIDYNSWDRSRWKGGSTFRRRVPFNPPAVS